MAKLTKDEFIKSLGEMTILEIKELVDAMQEEFGIDLSAVAVAAPQAGDQGAGDAAPANVNIVIASVGATKIQVIKTVKDITGLGLKEAKDLTVDGGVIKEGVPVEEAEKIKAQLEEAGATVEFK